MQDEGERSHLYVVHANTEPTTETEEPSDCNVQTVTVPTTTTTTTTTCTMDSAAATNMSFVELASLLSTAIKSPTLPKKPKAKTTTTTTEPPCINPDGSMETNSESGCDSSDESNDASTDEEAYVPTKREVYDRTHAVVRRNQQFVDTIYQQRGKVIAQDAKKLLKVIKKQEETKVLIEKGQLLLAEWKSSEQAQKLQAEGEEFLTKIQDNPEYSQLFNEGKIFLRCLKDSNATIEPSQIETILVHSKNLAERFSDDPQCESLIDLARSALREVRAQERHKEKWLERKKWLEEFILQADPEISETLKPLMEEGGKFLDDLKATDTLKMLNETKKILKSLLEEHTKSVLSGDGEEHVNMGTILTDGKRWVTDVVDEIEETDGKSEKFDKIVARASSATSDPEAQELISKGHKLVCGIMSNERSRKIIHHGKNVVKQISRTPEVKTLVEHTKQMIIDVATREQFHELLIENKQFLMDMKQVIIPFITEHIITVKIPPISGSKDSAFGSVSYEIWDIVLSGLDLLPENVNLDYDKVTKLVTLSVLNFDAHIRSFSWKYNKHTWPRISDSGSAFAEILGSSWYLGFGIDFDERGKPAITLSRLELEITHLDMHVADSKASRLYNWVLALFSTRICEAISSTVTKAMSSKATKLTDKINALALKYFPSTKVLRGLHTSSRAETENPETATTSVTTSSSDAHTDTTALSIETTNTTTSTSTEDDNSSQAPGDTE